ncbi:unnamed protein product [Adineta ricciae]|uniref:Uncharacterized protein n=1 Tax=Adineta ricciae TaxID=249248 RepID=A0A813VU68_ADIRI|nr:unnamed protein product [Adineta ricciae]CAF1326911.1 unnamed protein product [Adineta ricciae]
MSRPCEVQKCERLSRALCDCCGKHLCLQHLHEHNELLFAQLNPFIDGLNSLGEQLKMFNFHEKVRDCYWKLEQWRVECHQTIDRFFEQKQQELGRNVMTKIEKHQEKITDIQIKLSKLIRDQDVTQRDLNFLSSAVNRLQKDMNRIEQVKFSIQSAPLLIDETLIQIQETNLQLFDPLIFSTIAATISYPKGSWYSLTSNDRFLLIHQAPNLCLLDVTLSKVKESLWPHGKLYDMCWSSSLDRFIVLTNDSTYLVDHNLSSTSLAQILPKYKWFSCTCSNEFLYVTVERWGSSIMQIQLLPPMTVVKEWKPPESCTADDFIESIVYGDGSLALAIRNRAHKSIRVDLCSAKTFDRLWSFVLQTDYDRTNAIRCCLLGSDEWMIPNLHDNHLLHLSANGKLIQRIAYQSTPYRINPFGSIIAIATAVSINFHTEDSNLAQEVPQD